MLFETFLGQHPKNFFKMILIFSNRFDQSTNNVMDWLNFMGQKTLRINGDEDRYSFHHLDPSGIYFKSNNNGRLFNLEEAKSCWWRRQGIYTSKMVNMPNVLLDNELKPFMLSGNQWLNLEASRLRDYIYFRLYKKIPINLGKPSFDFNRLEILELAKQCGLDIPKFAIVRNMNEINEYCKLWGNCVSKAISNGLYNEINHKRFYTYTELIEKDDLAEDINIFPSLISECVEKAYEVRSFYLNGHFFSMSIFSQKDELTKIDFRKYANNRNEPFNLPDEVKMKTRKLFEMIGINTGSIDYMVNLKGNFIFLEINPVGQYGMTDYPCNYGIDYKIAKYLCGDGN